MIVRIKGLIKAILLSGIYCKTQNADNSHTTAIAHLHVQDSNVFYTAYIIF